jgi:hypothetical protein
MAVIKTKVVRQYCVIKGRQIYVVCLWREAWQTMPYWEDMRDFELDEYEKAREYARNLCLQSASKPEIKDMVEFHDGVQV